MKVHTLLLLLVAIPLHAAVTVDDVESGVQTAIMFRQIADLASIPLPESVKNVFDKLVVDGLSIERGEKISKIIGSTTVDDKRVRVAIDVDNQNIKRASIRVALPDSWKVLEKINDLKALNNLVIKEAYFQISNFDYIDSALNVSVGKGFNIILRVESPDIIKPLEKIPTINESESPKINELILVGTIKKGVAGSRFVAHIPRTFKLSKNVYADGLDLQILVNPPVASFSLIGTLKVGFPAENDQKKITDKTFNIELLLDPTRAALKGSMDGSWQSPFGIKGLVIKDVGIEGIMNFSAAAATGGVLALSGLGIRGVVDVGSKKITIATQGEVGATGNIMFAGDLQGGLYLADIVELVISMAGKVVKKDAKKDTNIDENSIFKKIPNLGFQTVTLYVVPQELSLAGKTYERGTLLSGKVNLFGALGEINMKVNLDGIEGVGSLSPAKFGKLRITSADDPQKGAAISLKVSGVDTYFYVDGKAILDILGGISQQTRIDLIPSGFKFAVDQKLFGLYESHLDIAGVGGLSTLQMPSVWVKASLKQDFFNAFSGLLKDAAQQVKTGAKKASAAISAGAERERLLTAQKIEALELKIKRKRAECDDALWYKQTYICPKVGAELTPMGSELAALLTYRDVLLKAGVPLAKSVTEKVGGIAIGAFLDAIGSGVAKMFNIQSVTFEGSMEDFVGRTLPNVTIKGTVLGREFCLKDMQLDFASPETALQSAQHVVEQIILAISSNKSGAQCPAGS